MSALRGLGLALLVLALAERLPGASPAEAGETPAGGVRVAGVGPSSSTAAAGLLPGDVLYFWFRPANPPGNPQSASGFFRSPLDFSAVLSEQTRRGTITLWGKRGSKDMIWTLPFGEGFWQSTTVLPNSSNLTTCLTWCWCGTQAPFRDEAAAAEARGDTFLAAWFLEQLADEEGHRKATTILARKGAFLLSAESLRRWCSRQEQSGLTDYAAACYQEVLEIVHAVAPGSLQEATVLGNLLVHALQKGDFQAAEKLGQTILRIREQQTPQTVWSVAGTLGTLADVASRRGDFTTARIRLARAIELTEGLGPTSPARAEILTKLGDLYVARGELSLAASAYKTSISMEEQKGAQRGLEILLRKMGRVESAMGNLALAEELLQGSLALSEARRKSRVVLETGTSMSLRDLAFIALKRGDLRTSEIFLQRAQEATTSILLRDPYNSIIFADEDIFDPQKSVASILSSTLSDLALIAEHQGERALAQHFLYQALSSVGRAPLAPLTKAESLSLQARIEVLKGDFITAQSLLRQALSLLETHVPKSLATARILITLGEVAAKRGQQLTALTAFYQALAIRQKLNPGSLDEAEALHALGQAELSANRIDQGVAHLCRAVDVLEHQRSRVGGIPEARSMFEASTTRYHRACLETLLRLGRIDEAFHALERGRARSFLGLLADRDLRFSELPPGLASERRRLDLRYDQLQAELTQKTPGREAAEIDRLHGELYGVRTRQEGILQQIRKESPHLASVEAPETLDLARAQAALDPGTTLLSYSVGKKETFLFVVQPETLAFWVYTLPVGENALRREIGAFGNLFRNARTDVRALDAQAKSLYDRLLRPAEMRIAGAERLLISPDGPLHTLPFAALRRGGQYLVEWKPVHSILSATVYAEVKKSRPALRNPDGVRLAAFGDPLYPAMRENRPAEQLADPEVRDAERGYDFTSLPATRDEVEGISELFPQAEAFLGAEATEERAKQVGPQADILHFACHGFLNDRFPLNSGLALTLPDRPAEGQDNGLLQAWEIFESVRLDADLVTLSACNTALGQEMGGEGLVGLTRAFQYAGARSVLASLWGVSDASTGELMKRFYSHLRTGKTKDEALRAAQIELIHAQGPLSHPYHWAAFQLFGDWK